MESHDEERIMAFAAAHGASSGDYNIKDFATACDRNKLAFLFLMGIPGPKMVWQNGEWADDRPRGSTENAMQTGKKPMPEAWRKEPLRQRVRDAYAAILHFRGRFQEAFRTGTFTWKPDGTVRWWKIKDASVNAYALGNLGVVADNLKPGLTGIWYDFFSREKISLTENTEFPLKAGEFHLLVDTPFFAPGNASDFTLPKVLKPESVPVSTRAKGAPGRKTGKTGPARNGMFRVEFEGKSKDLAGREGRAFGSRSIRN